VGKHPKGEKIAGSAAAAGVPPATATIAIGVGKSPLADQGEKKPAAGTPGENPVFLTGVAGESRIPAGESLARVCSQWSGTGWAKGRTGWGAEKEWGGGEVDPALADTTGLRSHLRDIFSSKGDYGKKGKVLKGARFIV